jgi:hypothetical protein
MQCAASRVSGFVVGPSVPYRSGAITITPRDVYISTFVPPQSTFAQHQRTPCSRACLPACFFLLSFDFPSLSANSPRSPAMPPKASRAATARINNQIAARQVSSSSILSDPGTVELIADDCIIGF